MAINKKRIALVFSIFVFVFGVKASMRNPFKKPAVIVVSMSDGKGKTVKSDIQDLLNSMQLSGIINNSIAIVNHYFYKAGDKIGIFTVKEIKENEVILDANGKTYVLYLNLEKIPAKKDNEKKSKKNLIEEQNK